MYQQNFKQIDFSVTNLTDNEYENCTFNDCIFVSIKGITFNDCTFNNCNFSNANTDVSTLNQCSFIDCKLVGLNFSRVKDFGFSIEAKNCNFLYATFERKKLNKSKFTNCLMKGANFTDSDLSLAKIDHCDFVEAVFDNTNLQGVDFTSNINFAIDPTLNKVKKAKFSRQNLSGLLYRFQIIIE